MQGVAPNPASKASIGLNLSLVFVQIIIIGVAVAGPA